MDEGDEEPLTKKLKDDNKMQMDALKYTVPWLNKLSDFVFVGETPPSELSVISLCLRYKVNVIINMNATDETLVTRDGKKVRRDEAYRAFIAKNKLKVCFVRFPLEHGEFNKLKEGEAQEEWVLNKCIALKKLIPADVSRNKNMVYFFHGNDTMLREEELVAAVFWALKWKKAVPKCISEWCDQQGMVGYARDLRGVLDPAVDRARKSLPYMFY